MFEVNSKVLVDFKGVPYPAKILQIDESKDKFQIHYLGWKKKYDEWVVSDRISESNNEKEHLAKKKLKELVKMSKRKSELHDVESIEKERKFRGEDQVLVKWSDFSTPSWEPLINLQHTIQYYEFQKRMNPDYDSDEVSDTILEEPKEIEQKEEELEDRKEEESDEESGNKSTQSTPTKSVNIKDRKKDKTGRRSSRIKNKKKKNRSSDKKKRSKSSSKTKKRRRSSKDEKNNRKRKKKLKQNSKNDFIEKLFENLPQNANFSKYKRKFEKDDISWDDAKVLTTSNLNEQYSISIIHASKIERCIEQITKKIKSNSSMEE